MAFCKLSTYNFPIYVSVTPELTRVQNVIQHCFKRQYIYHQINTPVYDFLEEADHALFKNISSMPGHPLSSSLPNTKESSVCLRDPSSNLNWVNTPCFSNSFISTKKQFNVKRVFNGDIYKLIRNLKLFYSFTFLMAFNCKF